MTNASLLAGLVLSSQIGVANGVAGYADGASTIECLDVTGTGHAFTIAQFKTLATAIAAFVSACIKCINGQATTLPSGTATIP